MKRLGLIGYPLEHSFSPAYFKEKFQREGLTDYHYEAFSLSSIELLPEFLERHPDLCGFNVTIPYKEAIIPYLDELDEAAVKIGAVNCVKIQRDTDKNDNCQLSTLLLPSNNCTCHLNNEGLEVELKVDRANSITLIRLGAVPIIS